MHVIIHLFKSMECILPTVNLSVNYGLWVILTCQCKFNDCNKCTTTLVGMLIMERLYCGPRSIWEISVSSPQLCCEAKVL